MKKVVRRKLMEQLARIGLPHLELIKDCVDEIVVMRAPEFEARKSVESAAKSRGVSLKEDVVDSIDIVVTVAPKKRVVFTPLKVERFYLVAGDTVTAVPRKSKADALMRSGANVMSYSELPDHLKAKVDGRLS